VDSSNTHPPSTSPSQANPPKIADFRERYVRVLITGGSSYVGRALTRQRCAEDEVGALDRPDSSIGFCHEQLLALTLHGVDSSDCVSLESVFATTPSRPVSHLAASSNLLVSWF